MQAATTSIRGRRLALRLPRVPWRAAPIVGVTLLAGVLRLSSLAGTMTNPFYDAAVRSMGKSWHNFFFAAFEPGASVSIDKPPLDLWLQVVSTKLFGFGATALVLPQALAATAAVPLLYALARRCFGRGAALASALALAVLPAAVMTGRSDTMDSLMMALTVLAAWFVVRSIETGRVRELLLAGATVGLAFEVKLFEGLLALPALGVLYALASRRPLARRAGALVASFAVCCAVALAWPIAVSLTPKHSRPWAIGSTNGSVWNAIFVFNGTDRLKKPNYSAALPSANLVADRLARAIQVQGSAGGDAPGFRRLFSLGGYHFGQEIGVELAGALAFGALALLAGMLAELRRRTAARRLAAVERGAPGGERGPPALPLPQAAVLAFAVWLLVCFVLFSRTRGVLHLRYLEAVTPAVAIALGVGVVYCARGAARSVAGLGGLVVALAITTAYALRVARSDTPLVAVIVVAAVAAVLAAIAALARPARRMPLAAVAAGLALLVPLAPATARSALIVSAGATDSGSPGARPDSWVRALSRYLTAHQAGAFYEVVTQSYPHAGPLIVHDGRPVLVLTGFAHRPIIRIPRLADEVRHGRVRYALIEGFCGQAPLDSMGGCPRTVQWLRRRSVDVTRETGLPGRGVLFRITRG